MGGNNKCRRARVSIRQSARRWLFVSKSNSTLKYRNLNAYFIDLIVFYSLATSGIELINKLVIDLQIHHCFQSSKFPMGSFAIHVVISNSCPVQSHTGNKNLHFPCEMLQWRGCECSWNEGLKVRITCTTQPEIGMFRVVHTSPQHLYKVTFSLSGRTIFT
jgi:hypothetical protein